MEQTLLLYYHYQRGGDYRKIPRYPWKEKLRFFRAIFTTQRLVNFPRHQTDMRLLHVHAAPVSIAGTISSLNYFSEINSAPIWIYY